MNENQMPKFLMYCELYNCKRNVGRPYGTGTKTRLRAILKPDKTFVQMFLDQKVWSVC